MSTDHAAFSLTTGILQAWNDKLVTAGICCDLAKEFDCVNYEILVHNYSIMVSMAVT
jgi:hypothetical protein